VVLSKGFVGVGKPYLTSTRPKEALSRLFPAEVTRDSLGSPTRRAYSN